MQWDLFGRAREHFGPRESAVALVIVVGFVLSPIVVLAVELSGAITHPRFEDFGAYYNAANRVLGGYPLYTPTAEIEGLTGVKNPTMPYLYPPIVVSLFVPLALLPFSAAVALWDLLVVGALLAGVVSVLRAAKVSVSPLGMVGVAWILVGYGPVFVSVRLGQISALLSAGLCFSLAALLRASDDDDALHGRSGALTALASVPKPFYAPSGAHLLRDSRRLVGAVVTAAAVALGSLLVFGVGTHLDYVGVILAGEGKVYGGLPPSRWHSGIFEPLYVLGSVADAARAVLLVGVVALAVLSRRTSGTTMDLWVFALGTLTILLVTPTVNTIVLTVTVPALLAVVIAESRRENPALLVPLVAAALVHVHPYSIAAFAKYGPELLPSADPVVQWLPVLQPGLWGVLSVYGLVVSRVVSGLK